MALIAAFLCALSGRVSSATPPGCAQAEIRHASVSPGSVCNDGTLNPQVKDALRSVCSTDREKRNAELGEPVIVIGFLGGFVKHGDRNHPEVWFARYLRERYPSIIFAEVFSNHEKEEALHQVLNLLDTNCDDRLSDSERAKARIIVYGHSWGASETAVFASELWKHNVPVLLTAQIDIVAKPHQKPLLIPPNVEQAINFFQSGSAGLLHGQSRIIAIDPAQTTIQGNLWMTYQNNPVDCRNFPWLARTFNKPHHEIENDARVWTQIDDLIDTALRSTSQTDQTLLTAGGLYR